MSPITKSRRSSILKPRKPRNPFSEIDLNPPVPVETTLMPQSRRVSFASSNFIKEFATDPEKNTIWHESYEEAINRSDQSSLASIQQVVCENGCFYINPDDLHPSENLSFDSDQFNCTKLDLIDNSPEVPFDAGSSDNTLNSSNCMELTGIAKYTEADIYKVQTHEILVNNEFRRHSVIKRQTINRSVNMNMTEGLIETNLRECQINTGAVRKTTNLNTSDISNDESNNSVDMETTDIISPCENFSKFNSCFDGTEQTKTIHGFVQFKSTNPILNRNEYTNPNCNESIVVNPSKRQTIHYNQESINADLEMTNINTNCTEFQPNITNFKRDMDVTNIQTNTILKNTSKRQTIHFNQENSSAGLEITNIHPDSNIQTDFPSLNRSTINLNQNKILENSEFNCIKENIPLLSTNQPKSSIKRQTIHFNQENPNANLEITNINVDSNIQIDFPSLNRSTINLNQNKILENSEINCIKENIPLLSTKQPKSSIKRQTIHFNQENPNANLEITTINADSNIQTDFPSLNRSAINLNQNKILENPEINCMKENIPLLPTKQPKSIIKRQTIHFNQESLNADLDETNLNTNLIETPRIQTNIHSLNHSALNLNPNEMKLISDIPSTFHCMKENVPQVIKPREESKTKRQTIHFNPNASYAGMDETNIVTGSNLKRQTIHFNPETTTGDMEVTESVQSILDKENISDLSQIIQTHLKPSSRQTIHFKSEEKNADIDITNINYEPSKSKRKTTHFLEDMEQTQLNKSNISTHYNQDLNNTNINQPKSSNLETCNFGTDIEETQLVQTVLNKENISDLSQIIHSHLIPSTCQTIHYQSEAKNADFDLTNINLEPSKSKRQTTHFLEDMEQTQLNKSNISTHYNQDLDNTNINEPKSSNLDTINFNIDIEETELVPTVLNKENISNFSLMMQTHLQPSSSQTIHFQPEAKNANIDITHLNYEPSKSKRQTQHFLDDMEQTQSVQTLLNHQNLSNLCNQQSNIVNIKPNSSKPQTISFDTDDMEETQSVQSLFHQKNIPNLSIALQNQLKSINHHQTINLDINKTNNKPQLKRQTCVYDQDTDGENMEETESVQTLLNKENTSNISVVELNRKTLPYNQNNEEIIEETQFKDTIPEVPVLLNHLIDTNQESNNDDLKIHPDLSISKDTQEIITKDLNHLLINTNLEFPLLETIQNTVDSNEINLDLNSQTTANHPHFDLSLTNLDKLEKSAEISTDNLNPKPQVFRIEPINDRPVEMSEDNLFFNNLDANFGIIDKKQSTSSEPDHCMLVNECDTDRCQHISGLLHLSSLITREPSLNTLSYIDSTEKLINYKINESNCSPMSEYSKIINDVSNTTPEMNLTETDCLNTSNKPIHPEEEMNEIQLSDENRLPVEPNNESINYDCSIYKNGSFIIVNSSSETDNDQSIQNLLNNENETLSTSRNSLELFVDKSKVNITSIESESIMLVESFSSQSDFDSSVDNNQHQPSVNKLNNDDVYMENMVVFKKFLDTQYPTLKPLKPKPINTQTTLDTEEIDYIITLKQELRKTKERLKKLSEREKPRVVETTLEDKIKEKSKDAMWKIVSMENEKFEFNFFDQIIRFTVHIDRNTEIVKESQFFTHLNESKAKPRRIYINNIFKIKLSQKVIHSACGKTHDILTLLDYVANLGEQMDNIQSEFLNLEFRYGLKMDREMNASFPGDSTAFLGIAFDVCFNLRNLDNMTEDCITIKHIVGRIHESPIKGLINGCPQGIPFIKAYYNNIRQYLEILTNEKKARYYKKR